MAVSNSQFDEIMRGYQQRQLNNRFLYQNRLQEIYHDYPRLLEIEEEIATLSVAKAKALLNKEPVAQANFDNQLALLREEKHALIAMSSYKEEDLLPIYTCKDCKDTGYIQNEKCHCLKQAIINTVYAQSNITNILANENFDRFSLDYYSDACKDPVSGQTALNAAKRAFDSCKCFVEDFSNKPKNILFYGDTGVGKTFLSNCVAKDLLDKGYSVIYFTAFQLFDILSKGVFDKDADAIAAHQNMFDCDLLIIDDLGTELANSFTASQLFLIVNERILRQRSTIISSNLSVQQLADTYSERTLSRITSNYTILKLFGDDIRIQKRIRQQ